MSDPGAVGNQFSRPVRRRGAARGDTKRTGDRDDDMPYVNIKITREGATTEQKGRLIQGVTDLLVEVLGKNPQTTVVTIEEVETDNWGIGGESVTVRREKERTSGTSDNREGGNVSPVP